MDFTSTDVLNQVVQEFQRIGVSGIGALQGPALQLWAFLTIIEFTTDWAMYDGNIRLSKIINDIIKSSLFLFVIWFWPDIVETVEASFVAVGTAAGGASGGILYPSDIINRGFEICKDLFTNFSASWDDAAKKASTAMTKAGTETLGKMDTSGHISTDEMNEIRNKMLKQGTEAAVNAFNPVGVLCYLIAIVMIIFAHCWIALQVFLTLIEFYIYAALSTIFIPFGVFRHTKFLFDQTVRGLISFGLKLMGTFFLIAVLANSMKFMDPSVKIPGNEQFSYYLRVGIVYLMLGFLVWRLPDKFSSLLSGSGPLLGAGEMTGAAGMAFHRGRQLGSLAAAPVAAAASIGLTAAAIKTQSSANRRDKDTYDGMIANADSNIASLKNAQSNFSPNHSMYKYYQGKIDEQEAKKKDYQNKKSQIGSSSFLGVLGTKAGAKLSEPWVGRRENLRRDNSQWDAFVTGDYNNIRPDYYQR